MATPKVTWTGKSGAKYTFNRYEDLDDFKAIGAVYIFTKKLKNGRWSAIYVGETGDLSTRFDDHHKMDCIQKEGATRICVLSAGMSKKKDRVAAEKDLLENMSPPCND